MKRKNLTNNSKIFSQAKDVLVGGVNSPVRAFNAVGGSPVLIKRAKGSKLYDYDGKSYIDYMLSFVASILGHANSKVVAALKKRLALGLSFGATNLLEVELAKKIRGAIPLLENIRFTSSGTEGNGVEQSIHSGWSLRIYSIKLPFGHSN